MPKRIALTLGLVVLCSIATLFACSQTPTQVPLRTFERAQRLDVVCLQLGDPNTGEAFVPRPRPADECAPVPANVDGRRFPNQLFALVTQTTRGELAVVNLTAGAIHDLNRALPGTNFLPVGGLPTDVAATPDGAMIFVASAEPNKAAIYGIPSRRILGDKGFVPDPEGPVALTSWPVCALPQLPGGLSVVPRPAGGGEAGADSPPYELVAILPGERRSTAKLVTIDPRPFLRGAGVTTVLRDGSEEPVPEGATLAPGALTSCPITSAIELTGEEALPASFRRGAAWSNGVPYVDGGIDLTCALPKRAGSCGLPPCCGREEGVPIDAGGDAEPGDASAPVDAGPVCEPVSRPDAGDVPLDLVGLESPHLVAVARDDRTLYVADEGVPLVHVVDLSVPGAPRELPPLVATSLADPSRVVSIKDLAISPATRDYRRYLYAVDKKDGSIIVYDVTDPATMERVPMTRPHPELNPFQAVDRIAFSSPVVAVSFARHDFALNRKDGLPIPSSLSGILCNPNPTAIGTDGYYYRAGSNDPLIGIGPGRLRGVFGFAALANGSVVTLDVDDWDSPCRRPSLLDSSAVGSLAAPQPPIDGDPYGAPNAGAVVTNEAYFPVSAPHRIRSRLLLKDDPQTGKQIPFLSGLPAVDVSGTPLPLVGAGSERTPRLRPSGRSGEQPSDNLGVRFSLDVPEVHTDQDWSISYEGALTGQTELSGVLATTDYNSLVLDQPQGHFCARGVEDWTIGTERANAVLDALRALGRPLPQGAYARQMVDYVQITDELLPPTHEYWSLPNDKVPGQCWDPTFSDAASRYATCSTTFGTAQNQAEERDFPILEAYDDHLVLGRFYTPPSDASAPSRREVVYVDPSNAGYLRLARCCFHNQIKFRVRAASQWVAFGSAFGFLHHVRSGEGNRCVRSCDPRDVLLESRAPAVPGTGAFPSRDSAAALRNPVFSFFVENGTFEGVDALPQRGTQWKFATRGQFQALAINLASQTPAVSLQSMRFVGTLGQIAIVDAASQGLVLIDLDSVAVARAPYF